MTPGAISAGAVDAADTPAFGVTPRLAKVSHPQDLVKLYAF
jgi:hypothetical protein